MNFWKDPRFWIPAVAATILILVVIGLNLAADKVNEGQTNSSTKVPFATSSATTATDAVQPQPVTINSPKLASNYFVYERSEYEKAKAANRPVYLFFYANWCPTCAAQEPLTVETFNSLTNSNLIGFRVNFNDSDTSEDEKELAKEFGVRYQHTMFTLDSSGKQIDKFLGATTEAALKQSFAKVN